MQLFEWNVARACLVMAGLVFLLAPARWRVAGGIVGGGLLVLGSCYAVRVGVEAALRAGARRRGRALVKFFTRHAMIALAAYVMMAGLQLDPLGMVVGVSSVAIAAGAEFVCISRRQRQ